MAKKQKTLLTPLDQLFLEFLHHASYRDLDQALREFAKLTPEELDTLRQEVQGRTRAEVLRAHALGVKLD